ncbi:sensor histidine kinase [Carboxylicivirga caseinilyticus]|uniref:sensor histidine kinase n=1 Tax=Carboxylicivirga caseinilyticus TaxID=3417572 RepID=UPI003D346004|nr:HAMP domain-containing histidine kinase [Marinilabiliaceae bacterium A049]
MSKINKIATLLFNRDAKYIKGFGLDDTNFIFTLNLGVTVFILSVFVNFFLDIDYKVHLINFGFGSSIIFIYWLAYWKRKFKLARIFLHSVSFICINILWFTTEASAGPASVFFMAYIPLTIFFTPRNSLRAILILIASNLIVLYSLEILFPSWIEAYDNEALRATDVMIMTIIFLVFEIPLLIFAKEAMEKEKNEAVNSEVRKSSMIANLSHEIRTPMNSILGFAELLSLPDVTKSEQEKYINVISQNGKILLQLLNNIINQSKLETNNIEASYSIFPLPSLLEQVRDSLAPSMKEKANVKLQLSPIQAESIEIRSDFTILYQILLNLSFNAFKFTDQGEINIGYTINKNHIIISVKDTGKGIPDELKPHIFTQFRTGQADEQHLPMQGAGLGLAICKGLTEVINGKIYFDSTEGVGSNFYIKLPINH